MKKDKNDNSTPDRPDDSIFEETDLQSVEYTRGGRTYTCLCIIKSISDCNHRIIDTRAEVFIEDIATVWCRSGARATLMSDILQMVKTIVIARIHEKAFVYTGIAGNPIFYN